MESASSFDADLTKYSSLDIYEKEKATRKITTDFQALDDYLCGGVELRKITEFVGRPGTGKTNMCLQLSLNVQRPRNAGGLEGKALYIDTRQDFNPTRLRELAIHLEQRLQSIAPRLKAANMLKNVHYIGCANVAQLNASILSLQRYLVEQPQLKLIVIDSLAFSLRMIGDVQVRTALLFEVHTTFRELLSNFDVALVITNEMTHRSESGQFNLSAALGNWHAHAINERIWFSEVNLKPCHFRAQAGKSMQTRNMIGIFTINQKGISGVS